MGANSFQFVVPGVPVPWARTNTVKGKRITPKRSREYRESVQHYGRFSAWGRAPTPRLGGWQTDKRYAVRIDVYRNGVRYDLDNMQKMVGDALEGILWDNDAQIDQWESERHYDKDNPRLEVTVKVLEDGA